MNEDCPLNTDIDFPNEKEKEDKPKQEYVNQTFNFDDDDAPSHDQEVEDLEEWLNEDIEEVLKPKPPTRRSREHKGTGNR